MLSVDPNARPGATDLVKEFSANRQKTMAERPQNVQIYQEFQTFSEHTEALSASLTAISLLPTREELLAAIGADPFNFWLWHAHSSLCARDNDLDGAINVCKRATLQKSRGNPSPIMELMNLHAARGEYPMAVQYGLELVRIKPPRFQTALSPSKSPLAASVISDLTSKEASLNL